MKKIVTYSFILAIISSLFISCTKPDGEGVLPPELPYHCYIVFRDVQNQDRMANIPLGVVSDESNLEVLPSFASKDAMVFNILDTRAKESPIDIDDHLNSALWFIYNLDEIDYRTILCDLGKPSHWILNADQSFIEIKLVSQEIFQDTEIHVLRIPKVEIPYRREVMGDDATFDAKNMSVYSFGANLFVVELDD